MEHKISSPIPVREDALLAYQSRKLPLSPVRESPGAARSEPSGRKMSSDSGRSVSASQKDAQTNVVQRKTSVSDLLSRLTMPTAASRNKMRDPARSPVSSSNSSTRSPRISSPRKFSNPNDVPKPRSVTSSASLNSQQRSLSAGSSTSLPFTRKPPSPPPLESGRMRSISAKTKAYETSANANARHVGTTVSGGPRSEGSSIQHSGSQHSGSQHSGRLSGHQHSGIQGLGEQGFGNNGREHDSAKANGRDGQRVLVPDRQGAFVRPDVQPHPAYENGRLPSQERAKRLSAPAPGYNFTSPRAMSRAVHPADGDNVKPQSLPSSNAVSPLVTSMDSSSFTAESESSGIPAENFISSTSSLETTETLSASSDAEMKQELAQLRELNQNLRDRNKKLKTRLEEALAIQDQLNVELSVSEAGRNSLQQQVNGYNTLQRETDKKSEKVQKRLQRSQKLVSLLKFNIQDLKMALEEKHLENYRLARKLKESGLEVVETRWKSNDDANKR